MFTILTSLCDCPKDALAPVVFCCTIGSKNVNNQASRVRRSDKVNCKCEDAQAR